MMAVSAAMLPSGPDWTYEVKWDGYRAQVVKNGATVSLISRNLKRITRQFPTVADAAAHLAPKTALIDGEIVALDPAGRPSFQASIKGTKFAAGMSPSKASNIWRSDPGIASTYPTDNPRMIAVSMTT